MCYRAVDKYLNYCPKSEYNLYAFEFQATRKPVTLTKQVVADFLLIKQSILEVCGKKIAI